MDVEDQMYNDMVMLDTANAQMTQVNDRVLPVLTKLTGTDFGNEPESWKKWWTDQLGYVYASSQPSTKETLTETVGSPDIVVPMPVFVAGRTTPPALLPGHWSKPSTAPVPSNRSSSATVCSPEYHHRPAHIRARRRDSSQPARSDPPDRGRQSLRRR